MNPSSSTHLAARTGRWSARHRTLAIGGWLAFVAAALVLGSIVGTKELSDVDGGTGESGRAERIIAGAGFPNTDSEAVLVESRALTTRAPRFRMALRDLARELCTTAGVRNVRRPEISADGHSALVRFDYAGAEIEAPLATVERVRRANADLFVAEFGDASAEKAVDDALGTDFRRAEYSSIPLTLLILLGAFGALVAAGIPLALALSAVAATLGLLSVVSHVIPVDEDAGSVILLIGLAVGVDYSLFYLRREREERAAGKEPAVALEAAAATSGRAVLLSGLTVLAAMAGMLLSGSTEIASVGVGAMLVVAVAVLGSLTVLPALLSLLGDRVEAGRTPFVHLHRAGGESCVWRAVLRRVVRRPALAVVLAGAPLVGLTVVAFQLHTVTPSFSSLPHDLEIVETYKRIQSAFPGGPEPAHVVIRAEEVDSPAVRAGVAALRARSPRPSDVDVNPARTVAVVSIPLPGNGTDQAAIRALAELREDVIPATVGRVSGTEEAVTGTTAESKDFGDLLRSRAPVVFAFVLALAFVLLLAAFRSLVIAIPNAGFSNFHENIPLRGLPLVTATPDETAIQQLIDRTEWAQQAANPAAYSPYVTAPVIYQFARGGQTVPNPTTSAILRACRCADRATLYRHDLAFAANPALAKNPHSFLTNVSGAAAAFAFAAQQQIGTFFASDGATTIDPDGGGPIFETPTSMVPEDLAYIP